MPEISLNLREHTERTAAGPAANAEATTAHRADAADAPVLAAVDKVRLRRLDRWRMGHRFCGAITCDGDADWRYENVYQDLTRASQEISAPTSAQQRALNLARTTNLDWSRAKTIDIGLPWHVLKTMTAVKRLDLTGQHCRTLPQGLPPNLRELIAADSRLRYLGKLPPTLTTLQITATRVRKLKTLPAHLEHLHAGRNAISTVQAFPQTLKIIDLTGSSLQHLPPLPSALTRLDLKGNELRTLPATPPGLQYLNVADNRLVQVPHFRERSPLLLDARMDGNHFLGKLPSFSDRLQIGTFFNCGIKELPKSLPTDLNWLDLRRNPLGPDLAFPENAMNLQTLVLGDCGLTDLRNLPSSLRDLSLDNNAFTGRLEIPPQLTQLSRLGLQGCQIQEVGDVPPSLRQLDLFGNQLTAVPRSWLEASSDLEIHLQDNPIPQVEIEAVLALGEARRAAGLPTPTFLFDVNRANDVDAFNLRDLGHTNAHNDRIVQIFRNRIAQLQTTQPRVFMNKGFDAGTLANAIRRSFKNLPIDRRAQEFAERALKFFVDERETRWAEIDFQKVTPLMVLAAVHRNITELPTETHNAALESLRRHLAFAAGSEDGAERCSTRHVEEVLSSFVPYQQYTPEVPWEAARDTMLGLGRKLARELASAPNASGVSGVGGAEIKARFQAALQGALRVDHPQISSAQQQRYLDEIMPHWETFVEMALEDVT